MTDTFVVVDLFAGAGGLSTGIARACERLGLERGVDVELHAVNHWGPAIKSHEANHPWAHHYQSRIEQLHAPEIVEPGEVDLLAGGPECTHFSGARGGKPVSDQKREPAWNVLTWIQQLRPDHLALENVEDFRSWGPIKNGSPTRDATIFEQWVETIETFGYTIAYDDSDRPGVILNAAEYGDPQARKRLFILGARDGCPVPPEPTHGSQTDQPYRTAAEVIDWSDLGTSLWTRDLDNGRYTPPAAKTMARIAEGIRRHCDDRFAVFADAVETLTPDRLRELRGRPVPLADAPTVGDALDEPFFVSCGAGLQLTIPPVILRQGGGGVPNSADDPLPTVHGDGAITTAAPVATPLVKPRNLPQGDEFSNAVYPAAKKPFHTITASNSNMGHLLRPYLTPLYSARSGQRPRNRAVDRPLMTVTRSKSPAALTVARMPLLDDFHGQSKPMPVDEPIRTIETKDRLALCVPELWPWGLDISYRMLQPSELKQAQGFPEDYELVADTKADRKELIGNAVPVNTACEIVETLIRENHPDLSSFGGGRSEQPDASVPDYQEVAGADD